MRTIIQAAAPTQEKSQSFYENASFKIEHSGENTYAYCNQLLLLFNDDPLARSGLRFYSDNWERILIDNHIESQMTKTDDGYIIKSPEGCTLYLDLTEAYFIDPPAKTENSLFGSYAGFSLESTNLTHSIAFWKIFDFTVTSGNPAHGYIGLTNPGGFAISIMTYQVCPHLFIIPSLSFFNSGKNLPVIEKIRENGIHILEEITRFNKEGVVDNIIIQDPGGLGFFIFND